jgi:hypothetical protein
MKLCHDSSTIYCRDTTSPELSVLGCTNDVTPPLTFENEGGEAYAFARGIRDAHASQYLRRFKICWKGQGAL